MVKINTLNAKSISYGNTRSAGSIKFIVVHYTGNPTDKAVNNAKYFAPGGGNTRNAGAHYFVDKTSIWQSIPDLRIAWSVGDSGKGTQKGRITNANSISIEMCSDGSKIADATISNVVDLICYLMKKYNIPISNIYRHYDVTAKQCPGWSGWYGSNCPKFTDLKNKVKNKMNGKATTTSTTAKTTTLAKTTNTKTSSNTKVSYYPAYKGINRSLVDSMKTLKIDASFANRAKIAAKNKIVSKASNYTGSSAQNTKMLTLLKQGKLIKP